MNCFILLRCNKNTAVYPTQYNILTIISRKKNAVPKTCKIETEGSATLMSRSMRTLKKLLIHAVWRYRFELRKFTPTRTGYAFHFLFHWLYLRSNISSSRTQLKLRYFFKYTCNHPIRLKVVITTRLSSSVCDRQTDRYFDMTHREPPKLNYCWLFSNFFAWKVVWNKKPNEHVT